METSEKAVTPIEGKTLEQGPVISIVVPIYNAESYLRECLESIVHQTYNNLEILCIDDGSTDNSASIAQEFATHDRRIRCFTQENRGVSTTRNRGLEMATGQYVMFVDSDDYISLQTCGQLAAIVNRDNPDIIVFGGKTFPTLEWADRSFAKSNKIMCGDSIDALLYEKGSTPLMCNKLYSMDLIRRANARFNTALALGEDNVFQFMVFPHAKTITFTKDILYFYRQHGDSAIGMAYKDLDSKVLKHFEIVTCIVFEWKKLGLLASHGNQLLEWISFFLYEDVSEASFNSRKTLSSKLRVLIDEFFSPADLEKLGTPAWERLEFMLLSEHAHEKQPLVTFFIRKDVNAVYPVEHLRSICNQAEQRIICLIDTSYSSASIDEIVDNDVRVEYADFSTLDEMLDNTTSPYYVFASANSHYDTMAVSRLVDRLDFLGLASEMGESAAGKFTARKSTDDRGSHAQKADVDIVVFDDKLQRIRIEDPVRVAAPDKNLSRSVEDVYPTTSFDGRALCICSLHESNKLYSRRFLLRALHDSESLPRPLRFFSPITEIALADNVMIEKSAFVSYSDIEKLDVSDQSTFSETVRHFISKKDSVGNEADAGGFEVALAEYMFTIDDALTTSSRSEIFFPIMRSVLISIASNGERLFFQQTADRKRLSETLRGNQSSHFLHKAETNIKKEVQLHEAALKELEDANEEVRHLRAEIDDFRRSASYKVGYTITKPMRYVYRKLKTIKHR